MLSGRRAVAVLAPVLATGCQLLAGLTATRTLDEAREGDGGADASRDVATVGESGVDAHADAAPDAPTDPCAAPDASCAPPSCRGDPVLVSSLACGSDGRADCCASLPVPAGTVNRLNDPSAAAIVSAFSLDRFEVTVARFRQFVRAPRGHSQAAPPVTGAGAHPAHPASGWDPTWNGFLEQDAASLDRVLTECSTSSYGTYGKPNDVLPVTCITWFEAFAFCAWDGGRLPTDAEWNMAASGGSDQRLYPWSSPPSSQDIDSSRATYCAQGVGTTPGDWRCQVALVAAASVGSRPAGDARWRHADMAGNAWEWTLDWYAPTYPPSRCEDCAILEDPGSQARVGRGGSFYMSSAMAANTYRWRFAPAERNPNMGVRCARLR